MIEAAFVRLQHLACVLAAVAVALTNRLRAELRALLRHLGEVHRHNYRRHADLAAHRLHGVVSCGRTGSAIHSSQVTGRMWSSRSISRAVATLVAIMQNASCGVRTWIACQLRFSASTIVLFRMLLIRVFLHGHCAFARMRCLFFVSLASLISQPSTLKVCKIGCLAWFCSRSSGVRDRRAPDYATRQIGR